MLNKLKAIHDIINKLWHEDAYDLNLTCHESGWKLTIMHRYTGKSRSHPESKVFESFICEETAQNVITRLKTNFVDRAASLANFRKQDCDKIYEQVKLAADELTKRLFILEEVKKL